jgi:hypothetical protein
VKDSTVRINEVLNFIQNTNVATQQEKHRAIRFANAFITNRYPATSAGQPGYETFSRGMSLGKHLGIDPDPRRNMKRAAYLLTEALLHRDPASLITCNPATISDPHAEPVFKDLLRKVRIVAGSPRGALAALNFFANDPRRFLKTNKVIVNGSPTRVGNQGDQNVLPFEFGYHLGNDCYAFQHAGGAWNMPGRHALNLDSVAAMSWTDVPGSWHDGNPNGSFTQIPGIELASPYMVTTQFTGCAFCIKRHNNTVYCAHLVPQRGQNAGNARNLNSTALAQELAGLNPNVVQADFANAPLGPGPMTIYGAGFARNTHDNLPGGYPFGLGGFQSYMTIVGFQRGPTYEIYSQVTQNASITGSARIF